ncbi:hypothetical protein BCF46_3802 [Litoreibacter meonggei]|uniref:Uncharacterized protein n=1 Tax=Litoreibacter meonggei TaxID=1049199 RepID=A0A497VBL1_9RHOB|nr:hypothetical protein [Litoreibacter meonggei]RLJ36334.1 hypothetical protein BCF46_3802 [Litoreibacter meonggei]
MGIIRTIRIVGTLIMFGAFVMLGHSYHTTMTAPAGGGSGARFVAKNGSEVTRTGPAEPTIIDSVKLMWTGLTGKKEKPRTGLSDLRNRTALARAPAPGSMEATSREIEFWTNLTAKMGFTGP